ncbi:MAG: orotidine-5'-phosphate decarboxylase [Anaerolineales bacterium]|nr:orotidine-5'-phosphate decarboxylase [Anaerolineales bacterium]
MVFFDRLTQRVQDVDSLLCVGLDPHIELLPEPTAEAARNFCARIIEATVSLTSAYKPNAAFFEVFGAKGWQALKDVIAAVPDGIPVILDAKRGDIASTARAYAQALFTELGADAVTLHPYLGRDAIEPFLQNPERGVFLLCKTSNPGSDDLQSLTLSNGDLLYTHLARQAAKWSMHANLGLVVGATDPDALAAVRRAAPGLWLLAPGVGAQGADLERALSAGLRGDGLGVLVSISRRIARADDPGAEARGFRDRINHVRQRSLKIGVADASPFEDRWDIADDLLLSGCVQFGDFTLKSGLQSPIYFDLRRLISHPDLLRRVAQTYCLLLEDLAFDRMAALPYAALPIVTTIGLINKRPMIYPRKEAKSHGTQAIIEGEYSPGETAVVIDDLATTGGSKFEAIARLEAAGLQVQDVVVLIDRQSGAREELAARGVKMHAVFDLETLIEYWSGSGAISSEQAERVRVFLSQEGS